MVMVGRKPCNTCQDPESCYFAGACSNKVLEDFMDTLEGNNENKALSLLADFSGLKEFSKTTEAYDLPLELKQKKESKTE